MEGLSRDRRAADADASAFTVGEPRELRALLNLSYSLHMIRRLPWYASDDGLPDLPDLVRQASRDALFTHCRVVADFFWKLPATSDNASLFLPSWAPPRAVAERLEERWKQAMTFIAPMNREHRSTPVVEARQVDLSLLALDEIGDDCDDAVRAFVDACEAADIELLPEVLTLLDVTAS
jgi:hypothetical protein